MRQLSREKLSALLRTEGANLSQLARKAGLSRQSLYGLLGGQSIYKGPFQKLLDYFRVPEDSLTEDVSVKDRLIKVAPPKVRKLILKLQEFCRRWKGSLLIFGSRPSGRAAARSDWDFGLYFPKEREKIRKEFRKLRPVLLAEVFPNRVEIINLSQAPSWFWESIQTEALTLYGPRPQPLRN